MCGFTILVNKNKRNISDNLKKKILIAQNHRGPDFSKIVKKENIIFFHNRLSILDLSKKANQPMICKKTGNIIVFNGEIFNFNEIKKLYFKNHKFNTNSDTEVLLELFKRFGKGMMKFINGIFSFVIFDNLRKELFLVRDRFGVKPLCFYEDNNFFICSTEVKPINILNKKDFNQNKIKEYLNYGLIHQDNETFFKGINKLNPASFCLYSLKKFKLINYEKYWNLKKDKNLVQKNSKEFKDAYKYYFQLALKRNLVSDVPIALLLSSGADSSYIHRNLTEMNFKNIKSFSFGWKDPKYDESFETKKLLGLKKNSHETLFVNEKNIFDDLKSAIEFNEGPLGGLGTLALFKLMKCINKKKYKVTISGEGSDELNLGYFNQQLAYHVSKKKINQKDFNNFCKFNKIPNNIDFLKKTFLLNAAYAPDGTILSKDKSYKQILSLDKITKKYINSIKLPKLLHWQDRCGGAFGIETRVPFLDHELATFTYSNPDKFKIEGNFSKIHLKNFELRKESKKYVVTPQREILKKQYKIILDIINNGYLVKNDLIKYNEFKKEYYSYVKQKNLGNSFFVWKVLNLELFMGNY